MASFAYMPDTHGGPYAQPEPDPERSANFAAQLLEEAEQAERCNFDGVFVPERHARTECSSRARCRCWRRLRRAPGASVSARTS